MSIAVVPDFKNLPDDAYWVVTFSYCFGLPEIYRFDKPGYVVLDYLDKWYKNETIRGALVYKRGFSNGKCCIQFGDLPRCFHNIFYVETGSHLPKFERLPYDWLT